MKITDDKHFMFIEPKSKKMEDDVNDDLTKFAEYLQKNMKPNNDKSRGWHTCSCKKASSESETFSVSLSGKKLKTNSLLLHYVKNHRSEIPELELEKLKNGLKYFNQQQEIKQQKKELSQSLEKTNFSKKHKI